MNYSEKKYRQRISLGQSGNSLMSLIAINLVVFVLFAFIKAVWYYRYEDHQVALSFFHKNVVSWFTLPADVDTLMSQPWTLLTYMFVHINFWQVFANMLWLWSFGFIMQELTGNRKIIPIFIYGSLAGALGFVLSYNLLPALSAQLPVATSMGASAGVMALAIATTLVAPGYRIFPMLKGGIPLWILTALYVIIDLATISARDTGSLISHVAGAFAGFMFMFFLRKGYDGSEWMCNIADWIGNLFNPDRPRKNRDIKKELFYKSTSAPYKKTPNITQQRVDEILDKINQQGYHFLTEEEKELLKRASEEGSR